MRIQCGQCDGVGGCCSRSGEVPDNCPIEDAAAPGGNHDCERDSWTPCAACDGEGDVDDDDDDDDSDDSDDQDDDDETA